MTEDIQQVAGGWALTGFACLCAGLWVLVVLPWPLLPLAALLAVDAVRCLRLGRCLAAGRNDPWQRKALARTLTLDVVVVATVAAATLIVRR
jgi:hypothetical protein